MNDDPKKHFPVREASASQSSVRVYCSDGTVMTCAKIVAREICQQPNYSLDPGEFTKKKKSVHEVSVRRGAATTETSGAETETGGDPAAERTPVAPRVDLRKVRNVVKPESPNAVQGDPKAGGEVKAE